MPLAQAGGVGSICFSTANAILAHLPFQQQQRIFDDAARSVGSSEFERLRAKPSTLLVILAAPIAGGEDFFEGLVAAGGVGVAQAELGVVDDRGQHVVEFVRGGADQFAQGGQLLGLGQLLLENGDLLLQTRLSIASRRSTWSSQSFRPIQLARP